MIENEEQKIEEQKNENLADHVHICPGCGEPVENTHNLCSDCETDIAASTLGPIDTSTKSNSPVVVDKKTSIYQIAKKLMSQRDYWTDINDRSKFYAWDGTRYVINAEELLRYDLTNGVWTDDYNIHMAGSIIDYIRDKSLAPITPLPINMIPMKNGVYEINKGLLLPHIHIHEDNFYTSTLPFDYDPSAKCPEFDKVLETAFDDNGQIVQEDIDFVFEFIGYCLYRAVPIPLLLIALGVSHTGKSTLFDIITELLGANNISSTKLGELSENRFKLANLKGKMLNISTETESRIIASDIIKQVTGGDWVNAETKGGQPFDFRPYAKIATACNELPGIEREFDSGFYGRVRLLKFRNVFDFSVKKAKILRLCTTQDELAGIFNKAIVALKNVLSKQKFSGMIGTFETMDMYTTEKNSYEKFMFNEIYTDQSQEYPSDRMYSVYIAYAKYNHQAPINKDRFIKKLKSTYGVDTTHKKTGSFVKGLGIKLLDEYDIYNNIERAQGMRGISLDDFLQIRTTTDVQQSLIHYQQVQESSGI